MTEIELTPEEAVKAGIIEPMRKDDWYVLNGKDYKFGKGDRIRIQVEIEVEEISDDYELNIAGKK